MYNQAKKSFRSVVAEWLLSGDTRGRVTNLEEKVSTLQTDVAVLDVSVESIQKFVDSNLYGKGSPLALTKDGERLVTDSGLKEILLENEEVKSELLQKLKEKSPQTKYDVQEKARELMGELSEYPPFRKIKDYAFDCGEDFRQILRTGAILLRDQYLETEYGETELARSR